jgi:putative salt-induced outer membrane protein YdiY
LRRFLVPPRIEASAMLSVLLLVSLVHAEDSEFVKPEDAGKKFEKPETHFSAEFGGAWVTGNAEYYTVNGKLAGSHRFGRNQITLGAGANLGTGIVDTDGDGRLSDAERAAGRTEIARKYWGDLRYDRFVGEHASLYVLGGALVDRFAGYDLRTHEQVGYSRLFVETKATTLKAELGADVAQENYVEGVDPNTATIWAGRVMVAVAHQVNENVSLTEQVEVYENILTPSDMRLLNQAAISARLSNVFSVKVSNSLTFDNVPVEGYRKLDQITLLSLVATLL